MGLFMIPIEVIENMFRIDKVCSPLFGNEGKKLLL